MVIAWGLGILTGWFVIAVPVAVVIGKAIHNADKPADELTEPEADEVYVPRSWVA